MNNKNKFLLRHYTSINFLWSIIKTGSLKSAITLNSYESSWYDTNFIYFTPLRKEYISLENNIAIYLDFEKTITKYPKYFINDGDNFGPGNGIPNKYGHCESRYTYYSNELQKYYKAPKTEKCYLKTMNKILNKILETNSDNIFVKYDEGSAEIGFYTHELELSSLLLYVYLPSKENLSKIDQEYITSLFDVNIDKFYKILKRDVTKLGGKLRYIK